MDRLNRMNWTVRENVWLSFGNLQCSNIRFVATKRGSVAYCHIVEYSRWTETRLVKSLRLPGVLSLMLL